MKPRLILELPIPLCEKHLKSHPEKFLVHTCADWFYIAIGTQKGSCRCIECDQRLHWPAPFLRSADLSYANLSYANLSYANLSYANLRYANLRYANLSYANLSYANLRYADLSYAIYSKWTIGLEALTEEHKQIMRRID